MKKKEKAVKIGKKKCLISALLLKKAATKLQRANLKYYPLALLSIQRLKTFDFLCANFVAFAAFWPRKSPCLSIQPLALL